MKSSTACVALVLLVMTVLAPVTAQQGSGPAPAATRRATPRESGRDLYRGLCSSCHGETGGGAHGTALRGPRFTTAYVIAAVEGGRPGTIMPAFKDALVPTEISAIAAYVAENASRPAAPSAPLPVRSATGVRTESADGFYTAEQARRGRALFLGNCAHCHTASRLDEGDLKTPRGVALGQERRLWSLVGESLPQRWGRVSTLFLKASKAMPADAPRPLPSQDSADIVAYILQANGFPAGRVPLTPNLGVMRNMMLNEPGFERLFNGRDFSGIKFVIGCFGWPRDPAGCAEGNMSPGHTFVVEDGTVHTIGLPQGYWYADRKFLNFTLRFDYRFSPPEDPEIEREYYGNSGYLLYIQKHQVWPKAMEIQGAPGAVLMPFGVGAKVKAMVDAEARARAVRPFGQWNAVEIVSRNGQVTASLNGALVSRVTEHEFTEPGYIGFQAEGSDIRWRNIRIRPE
jgi:mono/diheme cytochrome c family protein